MTIQVSCDRGMVMHLLRCWRPNRLYPKGFRLAKLRPQLIAKQHGICALCPAPLANDGKATHVDHVVAVDEWAARVMADEVAFDEAYTQLWADENLRAVCRACNMARNRKAEFSILSTARTANS